MLATDKNADLPFHRSPKVLILSIKSNRKVCIKFTENGKNKSREKHSRMQKLNSGQENLDNHSLILSSKILYSSEVMKTNEVMKNHPREDKQYSMILMKSVAHISSSHIVLEIIKDILYFSRFNI